MPATTTEIPAYVLEQWITRLADTTNGFNPSLQAILGDDSYQIDFASQPSQNFIRGLVDAVGQLIGSSAISLPVMMLDIVAGSDNRPGQYLKFQKFAGTLSGVCRVIVSWDEAEANPDFSRLPHATVAALYQAMNDPRLQQPVVWPNGIIYGGDMNFQITPVQFGARGWVRIINGTCTFRYATEN